MKKVIRKKKRKITNKFELL